MSAQVLPFPPRLRSIDVTARVADNAADLAAWQWSPGGRLVGALNTLKAVGYEHTADRCYAVYRQSLCVPSQVDTSCVGEALKELLSIPLDEAMSRLAVADGCRALAEMLAAPKTQGAA